MKISDFHLFNQDELPDKLYHYTSQNGLLEIIRTKSIWATDIFFLNDSSEYKYSINLLKRLIDKKYAAENVDDRTLLEKEDTPSQSDSLADFLFLFSEYLNTYICSFSEEGNLLSQWRGYCPMGDGFSIGFNTKILMKRMEKYDFKICQCTYDIHEQEKILKPILDSYYLIVDERSKSFNKEDSDITEIVKLMFPFLNIAPKLKDASFSEEKEWRFFKPPEKKISLIPKFRAGKSTIIPYYAIPLLNNEEEIPIEEIIIGPTPNKKLSEMSLRRFLESEELYEDIYVTLSDIPFRNW